MNSFYPINVDLKGKRCVVIGGGKVAERKVKTLLKFQADIRVVSPVLTKSLEKLAKHDKITHIEKRYHPRYMKDAFIVIGATNREEINGRISRDAIAQNRLVNIVDSPEKCNFFVPAVMQRGLLTISISTNGISPTLAKKIKDDLKATYGPEYVKALQLLKKMRQKIKAKYSDPKERKKIWEGLINADIPKLFKEKRMKR